MPIPPASPELNEAENIWQYVRQTYLSNRVFETYDDIIAASCEAWLKLETESVASVPWQAEAGRLSVKLNEGWYYPFGSSMTPWRKVRLWPLMVTRSPLRRQ